MARAQAAFVAVVSAALLATAAGPAPASRATRGALTAAGGVVMGTLSTPPTPAFLARVRRGQMTGVLLLGRWPSPAVVSSTTAALQRAACTRGEPMLVAADQEGGVVKRLPWAPPTLAPAQMGTAAEAGRQAAATAPALRQAGIDVDFAPVVDTPSSAKSFLGTRAFSRSTRLNSQLGAAFVDGLQGAGIAATAKHFPGLGEAPANTDDEPVVVSAPRWKLREGLAPFRAAAAADVKLVMVSSATYPALDPSGLPAVFSRGLVTGLLRGELGFEGVVVTDALDTPGPARVWHAATRAIAAGVDLLVFGSEAPSERAYATLAADAPKYPHLRARLAESAGRIAELKQWLADQGGPSCGSA